MGHWPKQQAADCFCGAPGAFVKPRRVSYDSDPVTGESRSLGLAAASRIKSVNTPPSSGSAGKFCYANAQGGALAPTTGEQDVSSGGRWVSLVRL
jgi:hypothetical protein